MKPLNHDRIVGGITIYQLVEKGCFLNIFYSNMPNLQRPCYWCEWNLSITSNYSNYL